MHEKGPRGWTSFVSFSPSSGNDTKKNPPCFFRTSPSHLHTHLPSQAWSEHAMDMLSAPFQATTQRPSSTLTSSRNLPLRKRTPRPCRPHADRSPSPHRACAKEALPACGQPLPTAPPPLRDTCIPRCAVRASPLPTLQERDDAVPCAD